MKNIYVGNISRQTSKDSLQALFAQYGKVTKCSMPMDKMTGQPRGFGFVEFEVESEGEAAIKALNGYELDGRTLRVNVAQDKRDGGGNSGPRRNGGGGGGRRDFAGRR